MIVGNPKCLARFPLWYTLIQYFNDNHCLVEGNLSSLRLTKIIFRTPKGLKNYKPFLRINFDQKDEIKDKSIPTEDNHVDNINLESQQLTNNETIQFSSNLAQIYTHPGAISYNSYYRNNNNSIHNNFPQSQESISNNFENLSLNSLSGISME